MRKPILYMLCGIPASGKTAWAMNFIKKHSDEQEMHYVSRDSIRFELLEPQEEYFSHEKDVFHIFFSVIAAFLSTNVDVIADATHLNKQSRAKLTRAIDTVFSDYNIVYVYFDIPLEICLERNLQRTGRAVVPEEVMRSMYNNMRAPTRDEDERCIGVLEVNGQCIFCIRLPFSA